MTDAYVLKQRTWVKSGVCHCGVCKEARMLGAEEWQIDGLTIENFPQYPSEIIRLLDTKERFPAIKAWLESKIKSEG